MTRLLLIFILVSLTGCGLLSNTKNETEAVQAVADFYGGFCESIIGVSVSTENEKTRSFELKVTGSEALEQFKNSPEIAASNVAYISYTHLKDEKSNYSEIGSQLVFKNNEIFKSSYSPEDLELIHNKLKLIDRLTLLLKKQGYQEISPMLSEQSFSGEEKVRLVNDIASTDPQFGLLKGYTLLGFKMNSYKEFNVLDVFVVMERAKEKIQLNVKIDLKASEDKIHYMNYKFEI